MTGCMRGWHDNPQKGGDIITKVKLDYKDGLSYLIGLYEKNPGHRGQFTAYEDIIIYFPGSKKNGDYRLEIKGANAPLHSDICRILYDYIKSNQYSYTVLVQFLEDIYYNGTKTCYVDPDLEYLQNLIFWITLQEEINYPSTNPRYAGKNLAYCRYVEAIYCTRENVSFTIGTVCDRCNNHKGPRPDLYVLPDCPSIYHY